MEIPTPEMITESVGDIIGALRASGNAPSSYSTFVGTFGFGNDETCAVVGRWVGVEGWIIPRMAWKYFNRLTPAPSLLAMLEVAIEDDDAEDVEINAGQLVLWRMVSAVPTAQDRKLMRLDYNAVPVTPAWSYVCPNPGCLERGYSMPDMEPLTAEQLADWRESIGIPDADPSNLFRPPNTVTCRACGTEYMAYREKMEPL